jgi:hypothetical protein
MKKTLSAFVLSIALLTTGCSTFGPTDLANIENQIQQYVVTACRFEPTLTSIAAVVAAFFPNGSIGAGAVKVVGDAICSGFTHAEAPSANNSFASASKTITTIVIAPSGKKIVVRGTAK